MQNDWFFNSVNRIHYPWVSRIDRSIYQKYPQLDPTQLGIRSIIAACIGYWLAKITRKNKIAFAGIAILPVITHYLINEWKLAKQIKTFDELDFNLGKKLPVKMAQDKKQKLSVAAQSPRIKFKNVRSLPELEGKVLNAKDFISQLPESYFRAT